MDITKMLASHYPLIKSLHILLVQTSFAFFIVRGILMMFKSSLGLSAVVRYTTYLVDMALLTAAILLLVILQLNPFTTTWIAAKLILLLCYIVLGSIALKRGRTSRARVIAYFLALFVFMLIYTIARRHDVFGFA